MMPPRVWSAAGGAARGWLGGGGEECGRGGGGGIAVITHGEVYHHEYISD